MIKIYKGLICVSVLSFIVGFFQTQGLTAPIVKIKNGALKGSVGKTVGEGKSYLSYRGIPFAEPPIGDLRFAAPVPKAAWNGTLDATNDRDECVQVSSTASILPTESDIVGSEDCLYLSVYTRNVSGNRPVMVWIYGGTFLTGSSRYDKFGPDYLIEKDIVYVAFNYRLGAFGFLSTEDTVAPGNWGIKDQVLALKWVKENIKHFGGDPNKITIFGESAGAASVSYLLQTNKTAGLYRGAIMQSGTTLCPWTPSRSPKDKAKSLAIFLGVEALLSDTTTIVKRLRKINYKKLSVAERRVTISSIFTSNPYHGLPFAVVKEPEHEGAVVTEKSYQLLVNGEFNQVPTIIGHNSFEVELNEKYYHLLEIPVKTVLVNAHNNANLAPVDLNPSKSIMYKAEQAIETKYFNGNVLLPYTLLQIRTFFSIDLFTRPIRKTAQLISKYSKVYFYEFSYEGKLGNPNRTEAGVAHAEDVQYLFISNNTADPSDILTRNRLVTLWTNFVKTLDPTSSDDQNILQNVKWIPNNSTNNDEIHYLNINRTLKMEVNPDQENFEFYEKDVFGKYGDPSYYDTY